jgi:hypothetical protein
LVVYLTLIATVAIQRFAGFASSKLSHFYLDRLLMEKTPAAFQLFAPRLFSYYQTELDKLYLSNPNLQRNFAKSVWPAATFNFGPQTVTFLHTDPGNLAWGWCSISSFGPFDHTRGGHLILWDLGLVVDFPSGSTVLIPSSLVRHSNTAIQPDERRYSFTQYAAGGLFRWVYNGFCSDKEFLGKATSAQKEKWDADRVRRWEDGLAMFSTLSEFDVSDHVTGGDAGVS